MRILHIPAAVCFLCIQICFFSCAPKKFVDGDLTQPGPYFIHLYHYLETGSGDPKEWCEEVTSKYCERGDDFLKSHFSIWKNAMLPMVKEHFSGDASKVPVELTDSTLLIMIEPGKPEKISVLLERGRLRINEL